MKKVYNMGVNQLKAGAVLSYVIIGLNTLVGLLFTPYMLRMMGQSEFGLYSLVASVIGYLTILDLGLGNAIIRFTAKFRADNIINEQYSMFGMFLVLYTLIGILAFILGLVLFFNVESVFGKTLSIEELQKTKIMVLIMIFNLSITFPLSIFGSIISAYENFIFQKVIQIIRLILSRLIMVLILSLGFKSIGMVLVITFFNIATLLINLWYCKYRIKIKIYFKNFQWGFLKEVFAYSFFIFLNVIMDKVYWSTGQFVLGAIVGTTAVAVFAVAIQLQAMFMSFSSAISGVFLPRVTALITKGATKEHISDLFIRTGRIQFIVLAYILSGFIVFGKQFISFWAGDEFSDSFIIALIFFIPLTIPLIQNLGIIILQARNQMKFRSYTYVFIAILSLFLQIIFAKKYGAIGVGIAIAVGLIIGQILTMNIYYHYRQGLNIPKFWKEIGKMSIVPITVCMFCNFLILHYFTIDTFLKLTIGFFVFSVIYFPLFWYISMNTYEKELITSPFKNFLKKYNE